MKTYKYTESDLENATLEWLSELGYSVAFGPDFVKTSSGKPSIAFNGETSKSKNYQDIPLRRSFLLKGCDENCHSADKINSV